MSVPLGITEKERERKQWHEIGPAHYRYLKILPIIGTWYVPEYASEYFVNLGHFTRKSSFYSKPLKQPFRAVLEKRCSENMQKIYRRTPMPKRDYSNFIEIALRHGCSPVNLLHIFRIPFHKNTFGWLLLKLID